MTEKAQDGAAPEGVQAHEAEEAQAEADGEKDFAAAVKSMDKGAPGAAAPEAGPKPDAGAAGTGTPVPDAGKAKTKDDSGAGAPVPAAPPAPVPAAKPPEKTDEEKLAERAAQIEAEEKEGKFADAVLAARPDAAVVAGSPEFEAWIAKQPASIQADYNQSEDWQRFVRVLALYDSAKGSERPPASSPDAKAGQAPVAKTAQELLAEMGDLKVGDSTLKDLCDVDKGFGPEFGLAIVAVAQKLIGDRQHPGTAAGSDVQASMERIQQNIANLNFRLAVQVEHPDAEKVAKSDAFKAWFEKASPTVQRLWKSGSRPEDAIDVLDRFKADEVKRVEDERKSRGREKKDLHDRFHQETLRPGSGRAAPAAGEPQTREEAQQEGESAFHEFAKQV